MVGNDSWDGTAVALRVRVLMAERGMKRQQLADITDLSYAAIGRLLEGRKTPPSTPELKAVAAALGVSLEALVQGGDAKRLPEAELDRFQNALLDRFQSALSVQAEAVAEVERRVRAQDERLDERDARLAAIESALRREGLM